MNLLFTQLASPLFSSKITSQKAQPHFGAAFELSDDPINKNTDHDPSKYAPHDTFVPDIDTHPELRYGIPQDGEEAREKFDKLQKVLAETDSSKEVYEKSAEFAAYCAKNAKKAPKESLFHRRKNAQIPPIKTSGT